MKAIVCERFGSAELREIAKPAPEDGEVLIRVRAASVNPYDWHLFRGPYVARPFLGWRKPRQPRSGVDVAGEVEAVGKNVTRFQPGDAVFGVCRGAFAEFVCTTEERLSAKPGNVTYEEAAAVPVAGMVALQAFSKAPLAAGQKVLINGASGGVGTYAVQIAKTHGAEVTGVCSGRNVELVRSLGADRVVDYTREDVTRSGLRFDFILDNVGTHSMRAYRRCLAPGGTYVAVGGPLRHLLRVLVSRGMRIVSGRAKKEDLVTLYDLLESGRIKPVIDRTYALGETLQALLYVGQGHARGKVVVTT
jgi:NADPH:quinone reductase-like Zn-dependent oxidoreductase